MKTNKKTETRLLEEIERLRWRTKKLEGENIELRRRNEALEIDKAECDLFVSELTHDLKSPTSSIRGLSMRLYKTYTDPDGEKAKTAFMIFKIAEMVRDLAELAREFSLARVSPLRIEKFDIQEVFDYLETVFNPTLTARNIRLVAPRKSKKVFADKLEAKRSLQNLVSNALEHGGEEELSLIEIRIEEDQKFITFCVYNNGRKLLESDCEKIFRAFVREDTSRKTNNSGLGLAIVRNSARKHGGTAWAEPGEKRGAKFFYKIPKKPIIKCE